MIHAQASKVALVFAPQSVATNGTATGTVNVVGYRYATVTLALGTAVASNVDVTMTLTEGDVATGSYTTATELAMTTAAPNTSTGDVYRWYVDLRKRKKNLKVTYAPNTSVARLAVCTIELSRAEQAPTSAAGHGLAGQVVA